MNRPGAGPQSLRGLPSGFPSQQQIPPNRSVSSRLPPSGQMAGNGSWAFGSGVPMGAGGAGVSNSRPKNGAMSSFAQTIGGGSQPATSLDLSEFPSLSTNQTQPSGGQSTWAAAGASGARYQPPASLRMQPSNLSSQQQLNAQQQTQQQQDDLFNSSVPSNASNFRFGSQNAVGQASQSTNNTADEFPPLSRNANGEIGQDRSSNMAQSFAFGSSNLNSTNPGQPSRSNGLLDALSGNNRITSGHRVASPASLSGVSNSRSPIETGRQGLGRLVENDPHAFQSTQLGSLSNSTRENNAAQSAINAIPGGRSDSEPFDQLAEQGATRSQTLDSGIGSSQSNVEGQAGEPVDPLAHMSEIDKWGLKGFSFMMNNYPDYAACVTGQDLSTLGFDLNNPEPIATQIYSLFDNEPPRPAIPVHTLPECYSVHNVAPVETKITNFNDEALLFMFYTNPGDIQQVIAAQELHNRNWRYHKKLQLWLTKDEMMVPQSLGNGTERGYYIFFDIKAWQRERREFTLVYDDLENLPPPSRQPLAQ